MDDRELIEQLKTAVTELLPSATAEELNGVLQELAARLDRLAELETEFAAALETARLDAMRELAYGASHEINNPLANISARAQTLLQDEKDPERRRRLAAINSQAFRAHEMIADLMLFARPPQLRPQTVDLVALADDVLARLRDEAAAQHTELARTGESDPLPAAVDPTQLRVALRALVVNALEAVGEGGHIEVSLRRGASKAIGARTTTPTIELVVTDDGPGIPPEMRSRLFDPFFSGREAGRGLGLGLSKCWRIVTGHGGRIELAGRTERGATFIISLPAVARD